MRRRFVATASLGLGLAACQLFVNLDEVEGVERSDASTPLDGSKGDAAVIGACPLELPPKPPDDPGGATLDAKEVLYFVARSYAVLPKMALPPGFNLDGRCTTEDPATAACMRPTNGAPAVDFEKGLDNGFSRVVEKSAALSDDFAGNLLTANASKGFFSIIVQLTNYNGLANDSEVDVAFISGSDPCPTGGGSECPGYNPAFEPFADTWRPFETTTFTEGTSLAIATKAYVSNRVLVLRPADSETIGFTLNGGATLNLRRTTVTAFIEKTETGYSMKNVVVGGIVPVQNVLDFTNNLKIDKEKPALCGRGFFGEFINREVCNNRDTRQDFDPTGPCDSLSFGFQFDTVPTYLGEKIKAPQRECEDPPPPGCN
jgi:hypothetical protein